MGAVDFTQWAVPDLELTFRGRTYMVPPPDVESAGMVLAAAVLGEIRFDLVKGTVPAELQPVLDSIGTRHPALSDAVYERMVADGVPAMVIDRLSVYTTFYWARGQQYADALAKILWSPRDVESGGPDAEAGGAGPKGS